MLSLEIDSAAVLRHPAPPKRKCKFPLHKQVNIWIAVRILKLISSKRSPYARKVRIALAEKAIPFELLSKVPWESTTQTPRYNPLEKLPVLILPDGKARYESHCILEYIEAKYPANSPLMPRDPTSIDGALFAKQVEVVADGICDALVLSFFEAQREHDKRSELWMARQRREIDGRS